MFASVIIPTYNRGESIGITLDSLLKQTYPSEKFEILVVDNNSTDNTAEIVASYEGTGRVKYLKEPRQGSHFARNGAVSKAKGELLYFTDDDMIADSNLLAELVKVFETHPEVGTATGRVIPHWEEKPDEWVLKYFENGWLSLYDNPRDFFVSDDDFGVFSCHQMVRRQAFIDAGGYNPDIIEKEWVGDNETGLCIKLKALGWKFAFTHGALTEHIIPKRRTTQAYFNARFGNQGNCDCYTDYKREHYSKEQLFSLNVEFERFRRKKIIKFVFQYLLGRDKWHVSRAYINYYDKRVAYNKRLIEDASWRELVLKDNWID